jgi:hypothetical protein
MAGNREVKALGPSYHLSDRKAAVQRSVNWYLAKVDGLGEDTELRLKQCDGLDLVYDFGVPTRGVWDAEGRLFVVAGSTLYEWVSGAPVSRGTLATSVGHVSMADGQEQLCIVDGPNGYVLNLTTNVFAQILSAGWLGSNHVEFLDGYFIFCDPGTEIFYISAIDDASNLDALDFSSADSQPDRIITHRVRKREVYFFGSTSCEVWINSGSPDFPLSRYNGTPIDVGCVGQNAVAVAADTLYWVGQTSRGSGIVYEMQGYQPVRVSTDAVEEALAGSTDISGTYIWGYQTRGAEFVAVKAPGLSSTWIFDAATRQWHERAEWDGDWAQFRVEQVAFSGSTHYAIGGNGLYYFNGESNQIAGATMLRERTWPHLRLPSLEPVSYRGLELLCTTGQGSGLITLQISNDGGYNYGATLTRSLGATGRWMQRVRWLALGTASDRVFRLRVSDNVRVDLNAATLDV